MTTRFYQELLDKDATARPMFTSYTAEPKIRFAEKLTDIVAAISDLDELLAQTLALGARHMGYGVRAAHYRTVGAALLNALASVLGDSFDPTTREAWLLAYNLVAETMLAGAAAARPIGANPGPATYPRAGHILRPVRSWQPEEPSASDSGCTRRPRPPPRARGPALADSKDRTAARLAMVSYQDRGCQCRRVRLLGSRPGSRFNGID